MTPIESHRENLRLHGADARCAYHLFVAYCGEAPPRVPGMDTTIRLATRLANGRTIEQAAAREYLYRWTLALHSPVFGVPHILGA